VAPSELGAARWDPDPAKDTLRPLLARLTVDAAGRRAGTPGFDPRRIRQWGYNAANDLQGINLNFIGSAGGVFSDGDRFAFDNPQAVTALGYVIDLPEGWYALTNQRTQVGFALAWSLDTFPTLWVWRQFNRSTLAGQQRECR
jgi:hypothetical protein